MADRMWLGEWSSWFMALDPWGTKFDDENVGHQSNMKSMDLFTKEMYHYHLQSGLTTIRPAFTSLQLM